MATREEGLYWVFINGASEWTVAEWLPGYRWAGLAREVPESEYGCWLIHGIEEGLSDSEIKEVWGKAVFPGKGDKHAQ